MPQKGIKGLLCPAWRSTMDPVDTQMDAIIFVQILVISLCKKFAGKKYS